MKLEIVKKADKELSDLVKKNKKQKTKIVDAIYEIGENPYLKGSEKLSGYELYRYRVGDYRILYTVEKKEKVVTIIAVKNRKEAYKRL